MNCKRRRLYKLFYGWYVKSRNISTFFVKLFLFVIFLGNYIIKSLF